MLLDPFISKSKGSALLSEMVADSLEAIERYRINNNENEEGNNEDYEVDFNDGIQTYVAG